MSKQNRYPRLRTPNDPTYGTFQGLYTNDRHMRNFFGDANFERIGHLDNSSFEVSGYAYRDAVASQPSGTIEVSPENGMTMRLDNGVAHHSRDYRIIQYEGDEPEIIIESMSDTITSSWEI